MLKIGTQNESTRDRWVIDSLKKISKGKSILDAGAGESKYKKYCKHLKYISQDFAKYDGKGDGKGLQTKKWSVNKIDIISDITKIPIPSKSVDVVLCTEVFEHIINPINAIIEFKRVLKKNGELIITAPFCSLTHFAPYHYSTGFNRYFYERVLDKIGFEIIELSHNGNYFEYIAQEIRRVPSVSSRYASDRILTYSAKVLSLPYLILLQFLSNKDTNSYELLCFGYHLRAKKL